MVRSNSSCACLCICSVSKAYILYFLIPKRLASRRFVSFGCKARLFLKGKRHQRHLIANERATLICLQLKVPLPTVFQHASTPSNLIHQIRLFALKGGTNPSCCLTSWATKCSCSWAGVATDHRYLSQERELGVWPILHIFLCWLTLTQHIPGISEVLTSTIRTWDPTWIASGKYGLGWCASWWSATSEFESFHNIQLNFWLFEELFGN